MREIGRCKVETCDRPREARGYCDRHYRRFMLHGDPMGGERPTEPLGELPTCTVDGCTEPNRALGFCTGHYMRYYATGLAPARPRRKVPR